MLWPLRAGGRSEEPRSGSARSTTTSGSDTARVKPFPHSTRLHSARMSSAHRPTWAPAVGKESRGATRILLTRDIASQTRLKFRQVSGTPPFSSSWTASPACHLLCVRPLSVSMANSPRAFSCPASPPDHAQTTRPLRLLAPSTRLSARSRQQGRPLPAGPQARAPDGRARSGLAEGGRPSRVRLGPFAPASPKRSTGREREGGRGGS